MSVDIPPVKVKLGRGKLFVYRPCIYCGKEISNCGFAHVSHLRKHVREGLLEEDNIYASPGFREVRRLPISETST